MSASASVIVDEISELLRGECAVIVIGTSEGFVGRYINLQEPDAARLLYAFADAVADRIPPLTQSRN